MPDVHDMSQVLIAELRIPELLNPHLGCPAPHNMNIFDCRTQGFVIAFYPITLPELVEGNRKTRDAVTPTFALGKTEIFPR